MLLLSLIVTGIEIVFLFAVGVFLSADTRYHSLSEVWVVISTVLVFHRLFLTFEVKAHLKDVRQAIENTFTELSAPIKKVSEIIDLSARSDVQSVNALFQRYLELREEKLAPERQRILAEAISALKTLNTTMKTPTLEEPDFYQWLYREFDNAEPGTRIQIVSMDEPVEWNDTYQEEQYFRKNLDAASRGVLVERIFFFSPERLSEASKNKFIRAHGEGSGTGLIGRRVDRDSFSQAAPTALRDAGQGFILVNNHFAIVDVFSQDGRVRGYVTFNPNDVQKYRDTFNRFHSLSAPLVFDSSSPSDRAVGV